MLENPLALVRRLPGPVRVLIAGTFVNKLGSFIIPFLSLVLSRDFRLRATEVGLVLAAYGVGSIVSILTGGVFTDRFGRRQTLRLSLFGSGALAMAMGLSPSLSIFLPLLVLLGFVSDLYRPASSAIIGDLLPSRDRAVGFAAVRMAVNLGFGAGMVIGGFLADWSWRALFIGDGLTTVLCGLMVHFYIPETRPAIIAGDGSEAKAGSDNPFRDRVFLQLTLCSMAFAFAFFADFTIFPLTVTQSAGYPARVYGMLVAVNGVLIGLFEVSAVAWLKRYRRLRVASLGMVFTGIGFGMTGFVMHWSWFLFTVLLWTAGEILTAPQQMAFVADWAPPAARGRYLSVYGATWSVGVFLCPLLFLPLHARLPEAFFWPILFVVVLPPAAFLLKLDRTADRPERLRGHSEEPSLEPAVLARLSTEA